MRWITLPLGLAAFLYINPIFAQTPFRSASEATALAVQNEPSAALSLEHAMSLAIEANPELAIARRELDAVAATREQAAVFRNPEISVDVEDTRSSMRQTTYWLGQPLELGGKRGARIESAERARDVASAELDMRFASVRAAVIQVFYEVLAAQESLRLAKNSMALANRGLDAARRRVLAGKVSPVEETRARVAVSGAGIDLTQANAALENARKRLTALWGNPAPRFTGAVGELEILPRLPSLAALYDQLLNAPEALRARQEVGLREAMLKLEESKRYPDLIVRGGVQRNEMTGERINLIGLAMTLPIFDRNQGNIYEAKVRVEKARDEQTAVDARLRTDLAQSHQRLAAALQTVSDIRKEILPGAQIALDATTRGFELGKFGFLDILDAQRTLFLARGQYVAALGEVQRAVAEVETILGPQGASLFTSSRPGYRD
ncbi:MAG: TolC family protein [Candidatus Accumulibacter sp.]|jgi:cobalt-zinc-cadmium efflux system outer membrane protein|nr:TolC family protein [Accumulibacter sp.]